MHVQGNTINKLADWKHFDINELKASNQDGLHAKIGEYIFPALWNHE